MKEIVTVLEKSQRGCAQVLAVPLFVCFAPIYISHKVWPIPLKREKPPDTFLVQVGQGLYLVLVVGHTSKTLELGLTSHSLTFNLSFLLFFLHITPGLGFLSFFSFLFLYFTGSLQGLAWLWAHLVAFNFHMNCSFM